MGGGLGGYIPQEAQFEEPQLAQELPPPSDDVAPLESVVMQQKEDSTRSHLPLHSGHSAGSSDLLTGRSSSNFESQSEQTYS